jgi:hypothetical protein
MNDEPEEILGPYEVMWVDDASQVEDMCNFIHMSGGEPIGIFDDHNEGYGVIAKWSEK